MLLRYVNVIVPSRKQIAETPNSCLEIDVLTKARKNYWRDISNKKQKNDVSIMKEN